MRVVFDISPLGPMDGRTLYGGGRLAETLAVGLSKSLECELLFSATYSLSVLNQTLDYLHHHTEFSRVPLLAPRSVIKFYRSYYHWMQSLPACSSSALGWKFIRRFLNAGLKGIDHFFSPLDRKAIKNADIFYTHLFPSKWAPRGNQKLKRVFNITNLRPDIKQPSSSLDLNLNRMLLKKINPDDWIICISHAVKNDICTIADWIDPNRIRVIYLGASEVFRPSLDQKEIHSVRRKYNIPEGPYLLCFNHPSPYKNTLSVVEAFQVLLQKEGLKDLSLVLVGYPLQLNSEIANVFRNFEGLEKKVIFTGFVSDQDLASLYCNALAFIYPSLFEGFGLPSLEAMQCGAPVIASNRTSIPEVVGSASILIDAARVDEICQAVLKIYHNPEYREKLTGLSLVQAKKFSWEKCIRETLDTYQMALNSN